MTRYAHKKYNGIGFAPDQVPADQGWVVVDTSTGEPVNWHGTADAEEHARSAAEALNRNLPSPLPSSASHPTSAAGLSNTEGGAA